MCSYTPVECLHFDRRFPSAQQALYNVIFNSRVQTAHKKLIETSVLTINKNVFPPHSICAYGKIICFNVAGILNAISSYSFIKIRTRGNLFFNWALWKLWNNIFLQIRLFICRFNTKFLKESAQKYITYSKERPDRALHFAEIFRKIKLSLRDMTVLTYQNCCLFTDMMAAILKV